MTVVTVFLVILMIDMIMIVGSFTELQVFLVLLCIIGNYMISVLYSYQQVHSITLFFIFNIFCDVLAPIPVGGSFGNKQHGPFGGGLRLAGTDHSTHCDGHLASFI